MTYAHKNFFSIAGLSYRVTVRMTIPTKYSRNNFCPLSLNALLLVAQCREAIRPPVVGDLPEGEKAVEITIQAFSLWILHEYLDG